MNCVVTVCVIKNLRLDFAETKYSDGKGTKKSQSGYGSGTKRTRPGSFFETRERKNSFLAISAFRAVTPKYFVPFGFKYSLYSQIRS